jgi:hypothetical protein
MPGEDRGASFKGSEGMTEAGRKAKKRLTLITLAKDRFIRL